MIPDTHCHLSLCEGDPAELAAEVEFAIDVGMGIAGSQESLDRSRAIDNVYATAGLHPNDLEEYRSDPTRAIEQLRVIASDSRVVAIGETGLDFYRDHESPETQLAAFEAQLGLAAELGKPVVIHCREAFDEILNVLDRRTANTKVIMHCFSSDVAGARNCADRGYFCSFGGNVTYRSNQELRDAARAVPRELILAETDSPFLSPVPMRGKKCRPGFVHHTARVLAEVRGLKEVEMFEVLSRNARLAYLS